MTATTVATHSETIPDWSNRPYSAADLDDVLALFTESDFYYRTAIPDSRPQWEIVDLLGDDTRLLFADGALVGLYAVETVGQSHACHHQVHLRLRAAAPLSWWTAAYREVVAALRARREVVRLVVQVGEFDRRGLNAARAFGLIDEGTLAGVTVHNGQRAGYVYFAQIWEPTS
ncbi:MAG TPA: hypothetical protein VM677_21025 [Actinokineospora sp.]|nr:hypothetical protein [Actinokineospora sp.]